MGSISAAPLASLVTGLAHNYGIECFVETGTFRGDGARFAATIFPRVVTIEINANISKRPLPIRADATSNSCWAIRQLSCRAWCPV
jgi:hypothetical protein